MENSPKYWNIGEWLRINGEAIYGSRPWIVYGEGPTKVVGGEFKEEATSPLFTDKDVRFTTQGDALYAIFLDWPCDEANIKSLSATLRLYPDEVGSVEMLGVEGQLERARDEGGLKVKMSLKKPCEHAYTLKNNKVKKREGALEQPNISYTCSELFLFH